MIKLPADRYQNEGFAVRARKPHRCEWRGDECKGIAPGDMYYRGVAWPGSDVNTGHVPWVIRICRACLPDERRAQFDAVTNQSDGGSFGKRDKP